MTKTQDHMIDARGVAHRPEWHWAGRNLSNYIANHPKAKGAKNLTEARALAFGQKAKSYSCKCGLRDCARSKGKSSHC